jgi:hypothetical protein
MASEAINGTKSLPVQTVTAVPNDPHLPACLRRNMLYVRNTGSAGVPLYVSVGEKHTAGAPNFGWMLMDGEAVTVMGDECPVGELRLHTGIGGGTTTAIVSYNQRAYPS